MSKLDTANMTPWEISSMALGLVAFATATIEQGFTQEQALKASEGAGLPPFWPSDKMPFAPTGDPVQDLIHSARLAIRAASEFNKARTLESEIQ